MTRLIQGAALAALSSLCLPGWAQNAEPLVDGSASAIRAHGITARLEPERRDDILLSIAATMKNMAREDKEQLQELQGHFQYALLLAVDPEIYPTLEPATVEAIDDALEAIFTLEDINRDNTWEPLIYAYGFFNRDVTPETISDVIGTWQQMTPAERAPRYPTYVHTIDAVTKPLAMGPLASPEQTARALELAIPVLKEMLTQQPAPGTAFHPPSHACLVLGPLYERWATDERHGEPVRAMLGDDAAFAALMTGRLIGSQPDAAGLSDMEAAFYAYSGRYVANALARMNARSAVPALRRSLALYQQHGAGNPTVSYTYRALIALGDETLRSEAEAHVQDPATKELAVWLSRHGRDETRRYGQALLGRILNCPPSVALAEYFRAELARLRD